MAGAIFVTILAIIVIVTICSSCIGSDNSSNNTTHQRNVSSARNTHYRDRQSYSECPSCGAPYFDGYCDECGYPDVNQGWLGEEYG